MKPKPTWRLSSSNKSIARVLLSAFTLACISASCGSGEEPEPISPVPEIEIVSLNKTQLQGPNDTLRIVVSYIDGDGDIGENAHEAKNLFVKDSRLDTARGFRVQQLAPDSAEVSIRGTLTVEMDDIGLVGDGPSETFTLDVYLVDRAGNSSDAVTTEEITISE